MPILVFLGLLDASVGKPKISLGIDYLTETEFKVLSGKKVGLLTHPAGKNRWGQSTVEVLFASPQVDLVALFGPEHGIYGDEKAAVLVDDKIDRRPVCRCILYGKYRKPIPKMLAGLDALVIDLQDVGVRCYTLVSCMRLVMEACFEGRSRSGGSGSPEPSRWNEVGGADDGRGMHVLRGAFQMPFVHGMTIAEIALWSKKTPGVLKVSEAVRRRGKLVIVPMKGWNRLMTWPQTGLAWHPTSPNIPTLDSVAGYPMTGLGAQMGKFKHGIGTAHPCFLTFEGSIQEN